MLAGEGDGVPPRKLREFVKWSIAFIVSPGRTGGQKPGFLRKLFAITRRLGEKPGFFDLCA